jgi:hypothetical protein
MARRQHSDRSRERVPASKLDVKRFGRDIDRGEPLNSKWLAAMMVDISGHLITAMDEIARLREPLDRYVKTAQAIALYLKEVGANSQPQNVGGRHLAPNARIRPHARRMARGAKIRSKRTSC